MAGSAPQLDSMGIFVGCCSDAVAHTGIHEGRGRLCNVWPPKLTPDFSIHILIMPIITLSVCVYSWPVVGAETKTAETITSEELQVTHMYACMHAIVLEPPFCHSLVRNPPLRRTSWGISLSGDALWQL